MTIEAQPDRDLYGRPVLALTHKAATPYGMDVAIDVPPEQADALADALRAFARRHHRPARTAPAHLRLVVDNRRPHAS